jgi:hypothetical protein
MNQKKCMYYELHAYFVDGELGINDQRGCVDFSIHFKNVKNQEL